MTSLHFLLLIRGDVKPVFAVMSLSGLEEGLEVQGELLLQDSFLVWEPKSLIRKGRDRHLFLFELSLIFSKEIKDSSGRTKYLYKSRLRVQLLFFSI